MNAYLENFLQVLKDFVAQQGNEEDFSNNSEVDISKITTSLSLPAARNIAKKLIINLLLQHEIKEEELKEICSRQGSLD